MVHLQIFFLPFSVRVVVTTSVTTATAARRQTTSVYVTPDGQVTTVASIVVVITIATAQPALESVTTANVRYHSSIYKIK